MKTHCQACGGEIGVFCFNPVECAEITDQMQKHYASEDRSEQHSELARLRSSNEAMRDALGQSHRLFLPIFMQLAEADLAGEPIKDEAVLFSFMGSGASDHVTVGEFRKALDAARAALNEGSQS